MNNEFRYTINFEKESPHSKEHVIKQIIKSNFFKKEKKESEKRQYIARILLSYSFSQMIYKNNDYRMYCDRLIEMREKNIEITLAGSYEQLVNIISGHLTGTNTLPSKENTISLAIEPTIALWWKKTGSKFWNRVKDKEDKLWEMIEKILKEIK